MNVLEKLIFYWNYPFVRYALIVGVLIALCSSLLGVTLVLKRFSFIGDGLSHVAFGGMAIATVLGMSDHMPLTLAVTVACAVLLLHTGQNTQIKGDAAIAMVSVGALAMGYLLMNLFSTSANLSGDVCSTLFGSTSILHIAIGKAGISVMMSFLRLHTGHCFLCLNSVFQHIKQIDNFHIFVGGFFQGVFHPAIRFAANIEEQVTV